MAKMIARRRFRYAGKVLAKGTAFHSLKKQDTLILQATRLAKKDSPPPSPEALPNKDPQENSPELEPQNIEKPRRRYKRRDMQAE